jgi:hypothetical protein
MMPFLESGTYLKLHEVIGQLLKVVKQLHLTLSHET